MTSSRRLLGTEMSSTSDEQVRLVEDLVNRVPDPYGQIRYSNGTMPTDYGFTGQHADSTSGLDYYNARYYDPLARQFTSADTVLPGGGFDILGLSRYAYVEGNPETSSDPSGHSNQCAPDCGGNEPATTGTGTNDVTEYVPPAQSGSSFNGGGPSIDNGYPRNPDPAMSCYDPSACGEPAQIGANGLCVAYCGAIDRAIDDYLQHCGWWCQLTESRDDVQRMLLKHAHWVHPDDLLLTANASLDQILGANDRTFTRYLQSWEGVAARAGGATRSADETAIVLKEAVRRGWRATRGVETEEWMGGRHIDLYGPSGQEVHFPLPPEFDPTPYLGDTP